MNFKLNGSEKTYTGDPDLSLLHYLRNEAGIISPKDGCSPQAACGCCVVQIDDKAVLSCVTPMKKVLGSQVITTEGMSDYQQDLFANAFVEKGGVQCGFCIPGIVMQSKVLLEKNPQPTRDEVAKTLTPHLCRCTGYKKIIDAVLYAAEAMRKEEEIPLPTGTGKVGTRHPRYDARRTVLGQRPYVADMQLEGMLYGALKFSDHPRAKVLRIDTSAAAALPGVIRIFTAADVPGDRMIGLIKQDWPLMIAVGEETHYIGDVLAGVVAESEALARQAVEQIVIDYDVLQPVIDAHAALQPDSPQVHPWGNVLSKMEIKRGDADGILAQSAYMAYGSYQTQTIEHGFMEPECCIAQPLGTEATAGIELFSQSQGIYEDQKQVAKLLGLPPAKVRVQLVPNGGGFGGKEDLSVQGHAALFAHLLQRPVRVALTRDESICMHPKRHPLWMEYRIGCDSQGKLTALKARIIGDSGAYASVGMKVLERAAGHATGAYHVPVVDVESTAVLTKISTMMVTRPMMTRMAMEFQTISIQMMMAMACPPLTKISTMTATRPMTTQMVMAFRTTSIRTMMAMACPPLMTTRVQTLPMATQIRPMMTVTATAFRTIWITMTTTILCQRSWKISTVMAILPMMTRMAMGCRTIWTTMMTTIPF